MKHILFIVLIIIVGCGNPQPKKHTDWPQKDFMEVRAYVYNCLSHGDGAIIHNGQMGKEIANPYGLKLTYKQTRELINIFDIKYDEYPKEISIADCYEPHHGFVFYNNLLQPVAHVSICFECQRMEGDIGLDQRSYDTLSRFVKKIGLPVGDFENGDPDYTTYYHQTRNKLIGVAKKNIPQVQKDTANVKDSLTHKTKKDSITR